MSPLHDQRLLDQTDEEDAAGSEPQHGHRSTWEGALGTELASPQSHFHGFLQELKVLRMDLCTCTANSSKSCCGFSGFSFIISKPDALISDEEVVGEEEVNLTVFSGI